jgi:hypothetical protein
LEKAPQEIQDKTGNEVRRAYEELHVENEDQVTRVASECRMTQLIGKDHQIQRSYPRRSKRQEESHIGARISKRGRQNGPGRGEDGA